ncbi:MAG: histidine kinase [Clostridium sp.]
MEFFLYRLVILFNFYVVYAFDEESNFGIYAFVLGVMALYLVYLNWTKFKYVLLVESGIALIVSSIYPFVGPIFALSLNEYFNKKIVIIFSYIPLVFAGKNSLLHIFILISMTNLFSYIVLGKAKEKDILHKEKESLIYEVESLRLALKNEQESKEQQFYNLKLEERNSLSAKMHDKVGHVIATSLMQLRASLVVLNKNSSKGEEMIASTINILNDGMEDIRATLKNIKPEYSEIGINKIKSLLENKVKYTDFEYSLVYKGELERIETSNWIIILDGIKELTTNILKYSDGNKISVQLEVLNKIIKVVVKDNGEKNLDFKKGMGLNSLEEKVINIGGSLVVNNHDGFQVTLVLGIIN